MGFKKRGTASVIDQLTSLVPSARLRHYWDLAPAGLKAGASSVFHLHRGFDLREFRVLFKLDQCDAIVVWMPAGIELDDAPVLFVTHEGDQGLLATTPRAFLELMCEIPQVEDYSFHFAPRSMWKDLVQELCESRSPELVAFCEQVRDKLQLARRDPVQILSEAQTEYPDLLAPRH